MKKFILRAILPLLFLLYPLFPPASAPQRTPIVTSALCPVSAPTTDAFPSLSASTPATDEWKRSTPTSDTNVLQCATSATVTAPQTTSSATNATEIAIGSYACILQEDVFFYSERNEKRGLVLIPKTYYVKLLELAPDFCKIEYLYDDVYVQRLVGYAKTEELTFVDYVPKRPYLYKLLSVRYRLEADAVAVSSLFDEIEITCAYYGDYKIGSQVYCYVLRDGLFGYVPKPSAFTYEENGEYAAWQEEQIKDVVGSDVITNETPSSPAQIAILIALCLLVPVLAALILRPYKHQPFDEDE